MAAKKTIFRIKFSDQNEVYELYAKHVAQSSLMGFVEIEALIFSHAKKVLVDPSEEKLKIEFAAVKRIYIPLHAVIRIDEVEKSGISKISQLKTNASAKISQFPGTFSTPSEDKS